MNAVGFSGPAPERHSGRSTVAVRGFALTAGIVVLVLVGQMVISGMMEGYCHVWPSIGTRFSSGYSERAFDKIVPGMTEAEVSHLLGPPLHSHEGSPAPYAPATWQHGDRTWSYSQDSSARGGDWAWLSRQVVFREGRVVQAVRWVYHD
jgi:hypothetical protein